MHPAELEEANGHWNNCKCGECSIRKKREGVKSNLVRLAFITAMVCLAQMASASEILKPGMGDHDCLTWDKNQFYNRCKVHINIVYWYGSGDKEDVEPERVLHNQYPELKLPQGYDFGNYYVDWTQTAHDTDKPGYFSVGRSMSLENNAEWRACVSEPKPSDSDTYKLGFDEGWWPVREKNTGDWNCRRLIESVAEGGDVFVFDARAEGERSPERQKLSVPSPESVKASLGPQAG